MSSPNPAALFERNSSNNLNETDNFTESEEDDLSLQKGQTFESFECTYKCIKAVQYQPKKNKDSKKHRN
ncbi:14051_t:CDS:2 [Funneliformis caledonium]|uniref:14051_t:CDS:1 n=1 Tax=Funneliformis caledonium TaxID=1117310 RepID=A0A9N9CC91_9GLOM|nr:14051_t:CDS:2 [Funneliformis caledonium]